MRDPARIRPMLDELEKLWLQHPDLRLGQLIDTALFGHGAPLFYVEDDEMLEAMRTFKT